MSRALLVLGAPPLSAPALRWAREAGLLLVVVDPDARAAARRLAHEFQCLPPDDERALVALARRLERGPGLAGVLVCEPRWLASFARLGAGAPSFQPPEVALEPLLAPERARELWRERGLPVASQGQRHVVSGFFRDRVFVPAGITDLRTRLPGSAEWGVAPSELAPKEMRAAYQLTERAALALGIEVGPVEALLSRGDDGWALTELAPAFFDLVGATQLAPRVYGKSPFQAWFAHLAGAGGPFDELPLEAERCAGWMAIHAQRTGRLAEVEGVARARALPGNVELWLAEVGREIRSLAGDGALCGVLWAEAEDRTELEARLNAARAALEVRVACKQTA